MMMMMRWWKEKVHVKRVSKVLHYCEVLLQGSQFLTLTNYETQSRNFTIHPFCRCVVWLIVSECVTDLTWLDWSDTLCFHKVTFCLLYLSLSFFGFFLTFCINSLVNSYPSPTLSISYVDVMGKIDTCLRGLLH